MCCGGVVVHVLDVRQLGHPDLLGGRGVRQAGQRQRGDMSTSGVRCRFFWRGLRSPLARLQSGDGIGVVPMLLMMLVSPQRACCGSPGPSPGQETPEAQQLKGVTLSSDVCGPAICR